MMFCHVRAREKGDPVPGEIMMGMVGVRFRAHERSMFQAQVNALDPRP